MTALTLELIVHNDNSYGVAGSTSLPLVNHVHKRVEKFIYTNTIRPEGVPISYLENKPLDSWVNLQISNRTYNVPANSPKLARERSGFDVVVGKAYSSRYEKVAVTNQTFVDERGRIKPLFFRHDLPTGVTEVELRTITRGNRSIVESGYVVDLDASTIYTNYQNYFDPDTGAYTLFYVVSTTADGVVNRQLLNPIPVADVADWDDIDLDTGKLTTDYPVYSIEQSTAGWNLYFNQSDTWYVKPLSRSLIQPVRPSGRNPDDPWFMKFTSGNFSTVVNGRSRRYTLPEFDAQPFIPSKPTVYSPYSKLLIVNEHVVKATQDHLSIKPEEGLHIDIYIEDVDGIVVRALTTDVAKSGVRYQGDVFWESDLIQSWDNEGGFISLGLKLLRSWSFRATYYYEADDFEYNMVSLNPLNNKQAYNHMFVFYLVPDVNINDRALHYLVVDHAGQIVYTSQGPGFVSVPNLKLLDNSNTYNPNTVIGLRYISDIESDTFITRYAAGFENDFGYMILAEAVVLNTGIKEDQLDIDARRRGGVPLPEEFANVIAANPRILQSHIGYGPDGQEIPKNGVMLIDAPLSLLEDYGGNFTQSDAETLLRTHMPVTGYAVINWTYPKVELTGWSDLSNRVSLSWTWEGPNLTYNLYRSETPEGEKVLITSFVNPAEGAISYVDTTVLGGETWYYSVSVVENSIEFPSSSLLAVKVR